MSGPLPADAACWNFCGPSSGVSITTSTPVAAVKPSPMRRIALAPSTVNQTVSGARGCARAAALPSAAAPAARRSKRRREGLHNDSEADGTGALMSRAV